MKHRTVYYTLFHSSYCLCSLMLCTVLCGSSVLCSVQYPSQWKGMLWSVFSLLGTWAVYRYNLAGVGSQPLVPVHVLPPFGKWTALDCVLPSLCPSSIR